MKVKFFAARTINALEEKVNSFLVTVTKVVDIKFSSSDAFTEVMVMYE